MRAKFTLAFVLFYKIWTKDKYALTSKYIEDRDYPVSLLELLEAVNTAMIKAEFKAVSVNSKSAAFTAQTNFRWLPGWNILKSDVSKRTMVRL